MYIVFYFELADDTYLVRVPCTDPYLYFSSLFFCGVQQVYHRLRLALSSSQSPAHQSSGWAIISSSYWIHSFTSWCLWISDMDHLFTCFGFLNTLRLGKFEDRCSWCDDFQILGTISIKLLETYLNWLLSIFWSFRIIYIIIVALLVHVGV